MKKMNDVTKRREIIAKTGANILGIKRYDKIKSPEGEIFTFLGVSDGIAYMERDNKLKTPIFIEVDTFDMERWHS